jgi:hypothetical protein
MALSITRTDLTVEQLRAAAARETDARIARRILAIAMVLAGYSRQAAAEAQAMERQTLRDWIIRYNEHGLEGLADRPGQVVRRCSTLSRKPCLMDGSSKVPTLRRMEWSAGAGSTCANG